MQNIINAIQSGDITNNKLLQDLTIYNDKVVDEFDEVMDALENRNTSLDEQSHVLKKQHEALLKQDSDKKIFLKNEDDLKKQSIAFQVENKNLKHQLSVMKKEAKASKEQIKRNKAALAVRDSKLKKVNSHTKETGIKLHELNTIYCKGEDVLLIYPTKLTLGIDGVKQEQIALLYTDRKGCFTTAFLDNNDEVSFSTFISDKADISDQTRKLINKNCMNISDDAAEFAQQFLYRVNRVQNMKLNQFDLTCFKD
jgi:hypothetical protein